MSTLAQLRAMVEDVTGRTDKTTVTNRAINFALKKISRRHVFKELLANSDYATVANDTSEVIDTDAHHVMSVVLVDTANLTKIPMVGYSRQEFIRRFPNVANDPTGTPGFYYFWEPDVTIRYAPKSSGSYTLNVTYWKLEPTLSSDGSSPLLSYDEAISAFATSYVYDSMELPEMADRWAVRGEVALLEAIRDDTKRFGMETRLVPPNGLGDPPPSQYWNYPFIMRNP